MREASGKPHLREQVRRVIRAGRYSRRTEQAYWYWIRWFIRYHGMRHPWDMGEREVGGFRTWLATEREAAAATQSQSLNALVFLYGRVLGRPLGEIGAVVRAKRPARLPVVLTHDEALRVIDRLPGRRAREVGGGCPRNPLAPVEADPALPRPHGRSVGRLSC